MFMNIVHFVTGPISVNTWLVPLDERRIVIVDPGGDADTIIAYLRERNAVPVLFALTHGHFDHITALPELSAAFPDVPIAIHEADAHFLGTGALERHRAFFARIGGAGLVEQYAAPLPAATAFLTGGKDIASVLSSVPESSSVPAADLSATGWLIMHTPGHSKGSVCLYNEKEKILVSGDTLFNSGVGRTDAPGGNIAELERSLDVLSELPGETIVLPGHGPRTTIAQELGTFRG